MIKLPDMTDKPVLFDLDGFIQIKNFDGWHYWIEKSDGEGFAIQRAELLAIFARLFEQKM